MHYMVLLKCSNEDTICTPWGANMEPSKCCLTTAPIILHHWPCGLGVGTQQLTESNTVATTDVHDNTDLTEFFLSL